MRIITRRIVSQGACAMLEGDGAGGGLAQEWLYLWRLAAAVRKLRFHRRAGPAPAAADRTVSRAARVVSPRARVMMMVAVRGYLLDSSSAEVGRDATAWRGGRRLCNSLVNNDCRAQLRNERSEWRLQRQWEGGVRGAASWEDDRLAATHPWLVKEALRLL